MAAPHTHMVCGASGDAGGAPGAPLWRVGALSWFRCTWVCAVLGGCWRGDAGCCVLCFLFFACVPLLTVCMLCGSYLCSGFFRAAPGAYSALCLVLRCTAPLDVSESHTNTCLCPMSSDCVHAVMCSMRPSWHTLLLYAIVCFSMIPPSTCSMLLRALTWYLCRSWLYLCLVALLPLILSVHRCPTVEFMAHLVVGTYTLPRMVCLDAVTQVGLGECSFAC